MTGSVVCWCVGWIVINYKQAFLTALAHTLTHTEHASATVSGGAWAPSASTRFSCPGKHSTFLKYQIVWQQNSGPSQAQPGAAIFHHMLQWCRVTRIYIPDFGALISHFFWMHSCTGLDTHMKIWFAIPWMGVVVSDFHRCQFSSYTLWMGPAVEEVVSCLPPLVHTVMGTGP